MTIKQQVINAIARNNSRGVITNLTLDTGLTRDQISKAVRELKYVKRIGKDNYTVKGRKVL